MNSTRKRSKMQIRNRLRVPLFLLHSREVQARTRKSEHCGPKLLLGLGLPDLSIVIPTYCGKGYALLPYVATHR